MVAIVFILQCTTHAHTNVPLFGGCFVKCLRFHTRKFIYCLCLFYFFESKNGSKGSNVFNTQVDTLLGLLSSETEHFCKQTDELGALLQKGASVPDVVAAMTKALHREVIYYALLFLPYIFVRFNVSMYNGIITGDNSHQLIKQNIMALSRVRVRAL